MYMFNLRNPLRERHIIDRWEDSIHGDWIARDGRLWRDMSWIERALELANNRSLRKALPKSFRDSRAAMLRRCRRERYQEEASGPSR